MKHFKKYSKHSTIFAAAAVAVLIAIIYSGVINAPFVMDDIWAIRDNPRIGDPNLIWESPLLFLRPLMIHISYMISGMEPWGYRIVNYLFHFGTTMFLFGVVRLLMNKRAAVFAALLYAVHPVLVESVIWISGVTYPQYAMFLMAALFTYILAVKSKKRRLMWYSVSVAAHLIALLSSEKAVVLPVVLVLLELSFFSLKKNWKRIIPYFVLSTAIGLVLLTNLGPRIKSFETNYNAEVTITNPAVNVPYSIINYIKLIFFPHKLTVYHADIGIGYIEYAIYVILFLLFSAGIFFAYRKSKPVFFWLTFFFISLTPTYLPVLVAWTVAERYVYLGVAGVLTVVAYGLSRLAEKKKYEVYVYIFVGAVVILFAMRSFARVNDFKTEEDLWVATVATSPESPNAHNNMGYVYGLWGDEQNAVQEYAMAIRLKPNYADAYHNMGLSYLRMRQYEAAAKSFGAAVKHNPNLWQSHVNLAAIYLATGDRDKAKMHAAAAQKIMPTNDRLQSILRELQKR